MTRDEAQLLVKTALERLPSAHPQLFHLDVTERVLTHHLANEIACQLQDMDVDVEYNRHGMDPKRLNLPPRQALDREVRATTVFPDVVVHRRASDTSNVLVLEVKKYGEPLAYDRLKLQAFKRELGFLHAAHVIVGWGENGEARWDVCWEDG